MEQSRDYADVSVYHNQTVGKTTRLTWNDRERHVAVLKARQRGLDTARRAWADFYMYLDADILLANPQTLKRLVDDRDTRDWIVKAPFLKSSTQYSNFWGA